MDYNKNTDRFIFISYNERKNSHSPFNDIFTPRSYCFASYNLHDIFSENFFFNI